MDEEQRMHSEMTSVSENNLGGMLFSDYNSSNLILSSDIGASLSSFEGALCFDESNNELVYVNMPVQMISSGVGTSESIPNSNVTFSSYGAATIPSLSDLPLFNDGGQVMLFTGGSVVIPNDDENLVPSNSDPFILEYVLNNSQSDHKTSDCKTPVTIDFSDTFETETEHERNLVIQNNGALKETAENAVKKKDIDHQKDMKHSCKLCLEKFGSLKDYKKHLSSHSDHKMHECKLCGVSFNKMNNLVLHQVTHSNDTKCPLSNCQKKFNRKASLKAHVKLHEEDESLTCPECGEEFRNQLYLELHFKYQSQCRISSFELTNSSNQSKIFLCKLCDRNFERIEAFNDHKKEHEKLKKALATKSHKKKTVATVPSSKINRCKMCPKWFLKPSQLVRHMRIHTGERPFVCNVCNKAFNQANSLKIHMLKHTGDRPFQCPFCGTSFSQRGNLRQHINRVHSIPRKEEKVYKCSECPCIFKKMCSLNAHKNRVHQQLYNGPLLATKFKSNESKPIIDLTKENAIIIENGADDVNDEDMSVLLDKDSDINTISINFDSGNGAICNQKVFVKKKGTTRYYRCSHCPKENAKLREIIRHLKFSILGKPFRCNHCSKTFSQRLTFLTHLTLHATAKTFTCGVCDRNFPNPIEMKIHSKLHGGSTQRSLVAKRFGDTSNPEKQVNNRPCTANDVPSINDSDLTADTVSDDAKKARPSSGIELRDTANLILPPYDCKLCLVSFESYAKLKQHLHGVHDAVLCRNCCLQISKNDKWERLAIAATRQIEEIHDRTCPKCGKKFRTRDRRDLHFESHFKDLENEVECQLCGKMIRADVSSRKRTKIIQEYHRTVSLPIPKNTSASKNNADANLGLVVGDSDGDKDDDDDNDGCDDDDDDDDDDNDNDNGNDNNDDDDDDDDEDDNDDGDDGRGNGNGCVVDNDNCDDNVDGSLQIPNVELANVSVSSRFGDDSAVTIYVPCNTADSTEASVSIKRNANIDITNDGDFSITNSDQVFTAAVDASINHTDDGFSVDETSLFNESRISVNENIENSIDLTSNQLKTGLLSLDSIEDNLFEFQPNVIPVEIGHEDVTVTSDDLLTSAGAVIYKSTKCYPEIPAEATDAQKHDEEMDCQNNETNTIHSYFYACNTCYLSFKNLPTLLRHLKIHDGSKSFECLYCGEENKTQAQLTHHIAQHSLHKEFPCVHCGELFDSLDVVKKHITDIHLMSSVDKKSEQKRKKNSASDLLLSEKQKMQIACQKPHKYSSISEKVLSSLLKNNVAENVESATSASAQDEKSFTAVRKNDRKKMQKENVCSYCSRGFKKMCDLVRHIRIHTGEKPFKCDYCSKCFTVKSILNCHLKTHFSLNNIFCHVCNRFFATVGSLKTHMRLHTGERPYKCLYCKETFRTSGHRDSHQKRHLGDKDRAAKWKCTSESALIEIEDAGLDINLEAAGSVQDVDTEYVIPHITDANDFKFQDIDLAELSNAAPTNKRSHCCVICRRVFKKKCDLDRHVATHAREKTYRCEICDSRFNQENTLKIHSRKHTRAADESCACEQCGSTFASAKNLKVHKMRHHPQTMSTPVKDISFDKRPVEIVERDKDVDKWCANAAEIFTDKMVDLKKYDGTADFYGIDRHFDLNTMMQDLFPDDEK